MTDKQINTTLQSHSSWVQNPQGGGRRADLRGADLRRANLEAVNLQWADLRAADTRATHA